MGFTATLQVSRIYVSTVYHLDRIVGYTIHCPIQIHAYSRECSKMRPIVIALLNTKGGVGKSTLTCNLAIAARADFGRVAILDTDPQHTLSQWWQLRGEPADVQVFSDAASAKDGTEALARDGWDTIFIDTPGQFIRALKDAAAAADFVLLPIRAAAFDLASTRDGITICSEMGVPFRVVLNDVITGERFADETREFLRQHKVPVLDLQVQHRSTYIAAAAQGKAAAEIAGGHHARTEMTAVWMEIKKLAIAAQATRRETTR